MNRSIPASFTAGLLLASAMPVQASEVVKTNDVRRLDAPSCRLELPTGESIDDVCRQLSLTATKTSITIWFENKAETYGLGFIIPIENAPDSNGDVAVAGMILLAGSGTKPKIVEGDGACRIAQPTVTACTFVGATGRVTAVANHEPRGPR